MGNDQDRLQQLEDNWNNEDKYDIAVEYFLDDGYPQAMAEELASSLLYEEME